MMKQLQSLLRKELENPLNKGIFFLEKNLMEEKLHLQLKTNIILKVTNFLNKRRYFI